MAGSHIVRRPSSNSSLHAGTWPRERYQAGSGGCMIPDSPIELPIQQRFGLVHTSFP